MTNLLEIENARKMYESFTLDDVCLTLPPGYVMGLVGPNGAGKTTLIKLIMNAVRRDGGTIRLVAVHCMKLALRDFGISAIPLAWMWNSSSRMSPKVT